MYNILIETNTQDENKRTNEFWNKCAKRGQHTSSS